MINGDYPTEEALKTIREWDSSDPRGLLDYIGPYWENHAWPIKQYKFGVQWMVQMSTGGWSGNESIIGELDSFIREAIAGSKERNNMFFTKYWYRTERGGHYWFLIPLDDMKKKSR